MIDDEEAAAEEEKTEEDREVQKIMDQGRQVKRKLITGTCNMFVFMYDACMYVEKVEILINT